MKKLLLILIALVMVSACGRARDFKSPTNDTEPEPGYLSNADMA